MGGPPSIPPRSLLEPLALFLATCLFAAILWWPLLLLDRSGERPADDALIPPPAWLLPLDDAYIHVRFAQQLARGRPLQWNDGEPSTGASSFLYPWLLVPGQWLFDDLGGWSRWSSGVGLVALWLLGLAAARLLAGAGLPPPWPTAAGLALIWSGPIGWVSIAGMDSALGCAAVIFACALWSEARGRSPRTVGLLVLIAILPLLRLELAVVVAIAALAVVLRRGPAVPRWWGLLLLLPGLVNGLLNRMLTGTVVPGGVIAKSALSSPFMAPEGVLKVLWTLFSRGLVPVYAGVRPAILPPPIGWLAVIAGCAVVVLGLRSRPPRRRPMVTALLPVACCWLALVAVAPLSGYLTWQHYRHHHAGLACAWVLGIAACAVLARKVGSRWAANPGWRRILVLGLPFALLAGASHWSYDYFRTTVDLYQDNGVVAEWLREHLSGEVLLVHDAGLVAIAHDGPAIDVMGLGTSEFALAYRDGPGAVVEGLARRDPRPSFAAGRGPQLRIGELLGRPLVVAPSARYLQNPMAVAELRVELLARTALRRPGLDLAHLPAERRHLMIWTKPPRSHRASFALTLLGADGESQLQGCRPLRDELGVGLPEGIARIRLRAAALPGQEARLRVFLGPRAGPAGRAREEVRLRPGAAGWTETSAAIAGGGSMLWLQNDGPGIPCIESIAFFVDNPTPALH